MSHCKVMCQVLTMYDLRHPPGKDRFGQPNYSHSSHVRAMRDCFLICPRKILNRVSIPSSFRQPLWRWEARDVSISKPRSFNKSLGACQPERQLSSFGWTGNVLFATDLHSAHRSRIRSFRYLSTSAFPLAFADHGQFGRDSKALESGSR